MKRRPIASLKQNILKLDIEMFCGLIILFFLLNISLFTPKYLMNRFWSGPSLFYEFTIVILLLWMAIKAFVKRSSIIAINKIDIFIILICLYTLLHNYFAFNYFITTDQSVIFVCWMFLFFFIKDYVHRLSLKKIKKFLRLFILIVAITVTIYCIIGIKQFLKLSLPNNLNFVITGPFYNPASFAIYISVLLPFLFVPCLYLPFSDKKNKIIVLICCIAISSAFVALIVCECRSAWISIALGFFFIISCRYRSLLGYIRNNFLKITLPIFLLFCALVYYKPISSFSRITIWKISMELINKNKFFGIGHGNFQYQYNLYQSDFFFNGKGTSFETKYADIVRFPYNEIIHTVSEMGLIGSLFHLGLIVSLFFSAKCILRGSNESQLILAVSAYASIFTISICGLFSYPLSIVPVLVISSVNIGIISSFAKQKTIRFDKFYLILCGVILLSSSYLLFNYTFNRYQSFKVWKDTTSLKQLLVIFPNIKDSPNFLLDLSNLMIKEKKYSELIYVFNDASNRMAFPSLYLNLAKAQYEMKDFYRAQKNFEKAYFMVPNRFLSRYLLIKFYFETGQNESAIMLSKSALKEEPKVDSQEIKDIKKKISNLMIEYLK